MNRDLEESCLSVEENLDRTGAAHSAAQAELLGRASQPCLVLAADLALSGDGFSPGGRQGAAGLHTALPSPPVACSSLQRAAAVPTGPAYSADPSSLLPLMYSLRLVRLWFSPFSPQLKLLESTRVLGVAGTGGKEEAPGPHGAGRR